MRRRDSSETGSTVTRFNRIIHTAVALTAAACVLSGNATAQSASATGASAEQMGRIVGRVIDQSNGQGLTDVQIYVEGTRLGTSSGVDGRYIILNVPEGAVTLRVRRIGYQEKLISAVIVQGGKAVEQVISLNTAPAQQLEAVSVTASAERGSVAEALDAQRTAINVVNSVTQEQISRSPDSDAAQAVQRVSAVSLKDGNVLVRGLDPRYSTTELNGARVPSPEPEKRMVPLDLFPSGLIQSITTAKTFTPNLQGDFSGAVVNIRTREFPAERTWAAAFTGGYASGTTGQRALAGSAVGGETFAMATSERSLPAIIRDVGSFQGLNLSQADKNLLVSQFRNSWSPGAATVLPNGSGSVSFGGSDRVLSQQFGYLFSATYSQSNDRRENQVRAVANRGPTVGSTEAADRFEGESSTQSVLLGGLVNVSTLLGTRTRIAFNGMYNRTADNSARIEEGAFENEGIRARITRLQYVERSVHSSQLAVEHQLGAHHIDWTATSSGVRRSEPDRSEFVQAIETADDGVEVLRWLSAGTGGAVRTFSDLAETAREVAANYTLNFGQYSHALRTGVLARSTNRVADNRAFSLSAPTAPLAVRELPAEQLFDGRYTGPSDSLFDIRALAQGGSYDATDRILAGYVMAEFSFGDRYRALGGARYESDRLELNATSTLGGAVTVRKQWDDVLPALGLTVQLGPTQQLRVAASQTLARPEYRELAPISTREVLNGDNQQGNDALRRTNITNADLRWEWYPGADELLSVGVFTKIFNNPIERVYRSVSGSRLVFFTNADKADNYGIEIEARKGLGFLSERLASVGVFSNVTLMHSEITLDPNTQASATSHRRRMVGQAPYVVNAGLTYVSAQGGTSATALFNRIGERIDAAGDAPLPDVIERPRNAVDLSMRHQLSASVSVRADAKNVLDAPHRIEQGSVVRSSYRTGRTLQIGFQWRAGN